MKPRGMVQAAMVALLAVGSPTYGADRVAELANQFRNEVQSHCIKTTVGFPEKNRQAACSCIMRHLSSYNDLDAIGMMRKEGLVYDSFSEDVDACFERFSVSSNQKLMATPPPRPLSTSDSIRHWAANVPDLAVMVKATVEKYRYSVDFGGLSNEAWATAIERIVRDQIEDRIHKAEGQDYTDAINLLTESYETLYWCRRNDSDAFEKAVQIDNELRKIGVMSMVDRFEVASTACE